MCPFDLVGIDDDDDEDGLAPFANEPAIAEDVCGPAIETLLANELYSC